MAVLRASVGHVTRLRPTGAGLPGGLSVIHYVAIGAPLLSPFIPLYKGLAPEALPRELACAGSWPDPSSLFWRARRLQVCAQYDATARGWGCVILSTTCSTAKCPGLRPRPGPVQALVFQDWPALAPAATAGILSFERDVEQRQQPAAERRYTAALAGGKEERAAVELARFTAAVVAQAGALLQRLAATRPPPWGSLGCHQTSGWWRCWMLRQSSTLSGGNAAAAAGEGAWLPWALMLVPLCCNCETPGRTAFFTLSTGGLRQLGAHSACHAAQSPHAKHTANLTQESRAGCRQQNAPEHRRPRAQRSFSFCANCSSGCFL